MIKYVLKRIALLIPIMLGVSAIIFTLKTFTPGDPVRQICLLYTSSQHRSWHRFHQPCGKKQSTVYWMECLFQSNKDTETVEN